MPSGLGSGIASSCLPYLLSGHSPCLLGPRDGQVTLGNLLCHHPRDLKGNSHARDMGMPMRWESPLESGVRSSPSGEHPCHLLTFSPFRPGGPAGPRGPGSPGRPYKKENLSPWGCNSALGTHSHCSPDPLCQPCWRRVLTHWGSRIPSRYCPIYESRGALQREGSAPVWLP